MTRRGRRSRRWLAGLVLLLVVVATLGALHASVLAAAGRFLSRGDPLASADRVLVLESDGRLYVAAQLLDRGLAGGVLLIDGSPDRLELAGLVPSDLELAYRVLAERGVQESAVETLGRADNTSAQARLLASWLERRPESTVVVPCELFAARKLRLAFARLLGQTADRVRWLPVADRRFDAARWWRSETGLLAFLDGSVGFLYTLLQGEDRRAERLRDPDRWLASRPRAVPKAPAEG